MTETPDHELLRQIEERRNDPEFMARLKRFMEEDRDILERLADGEGDDPSDPRAAA